MKIEKRKKVTRWRILKITLEIVTLAFMIAGFILASILLNSNLTEGWYSVELTFLLIVAILSATEFSYIRNYFTFSSYVRRFTRVAKWRAIKLTLELLSLAVGISGTILAFMHLFDSVTVEYWQWAFIAILGYFIFMDIRNVFTFSYYISKRTR